eukprot:jgi/Tetstr1/429603/TSEL_019501.t1
MAMRRAAASLLAASRRGATTPASAATVALPALRTYSSAAGGDRGGLAGGPDLDFFLRQGQPLVAPATTAPQGGVDYAAISPGLGQGEEEHATGAAPLSVYLETYGCQMNVSDSQVVQSILADAGFREAGGADDADVILINTCAIRENAESKVWHRLGAFRNLKTKRSRSQRPTVGVLGCMAERLKTRLLESDKLVDVVVGPDAYRDLPHLLRSVRDSPDRRATAMNVQLSLEETYADVMPVRQRGSLSAYLSIMRGCNNMCAFCIVPFTRGRERSRGAASILREVENVNSYSDTSEVGDAEAAPAADPFGAYAPGFTSVYKPQRGRALTFAELLDRVARVDPEMRIRFTSPHPKDFNEEVLHTVARHHNICSQLHMPAQSGSSSVLASMRRGYTREAYDALIDRVRRILPQVALSTDIITGFCGETEEDHAATVQLMRATGYDQAFMFAYSRRDKTHAARHLEDDVPAEVKQRRLAEVIEVFREGLTARNTAEVGRRHIVLVEGPSKRDPDVWTGRTCHFKRVLFRYAPVAASYGTMEAADAADICIGDYVAVQIERATAGTLHGAGAGAHFHRRVCEAPRLHDAGGGLPPGGGGFSGPSRVQTQ